MTMTRTDRLGTLAHGLLLAVAVALPFELTAPAFAAGPLSITNVEILIYGLVVSWGAWRVARATTHGVGSLVQLPDRDGYRTFGPAHWLVLAWLLTVALSAASTTLHPGPAAKFALRTAGGCLLFFAAADLVWSSRRAGLVALALLGGGALSAIAAHAEIWWPAVRPALSAFKTQPTFAGGILRASGTFQYANTASMYWEAMLPLALLGAAWSIRRPARGEGHRRATVVAAAAAALLTTALVLGASRAGLVVASVVVFAVLVVDRRPAVAWPVGAALAMGGALMALSPQTGGLLALRMASDDQATWYRAGFDIPPRLDFEAGKWRRVRVGLRNDGRFHWPASGEHPVHLSYHWRDPVMDRIVVFEGHRNRLPADLAPGDSATIDAWVLAPPAPGAYTLELDLVHEGVIWFSVLAAPMGSIQAAVAAVSSPALGQTPPPPTVFPQVRPPRRRLWTAALALWRERPLLGVGPDNFRRLYGPRIGQPVFDDRITTNNMYLEMLVNLGATGGLVFLALSVALGRAALRLVLAPIHSPEASADRILDAAFGLALATFLVHGLVDYFLEVTPTYALFWIASGTVVALDRMSPPAAGPRTAETGTR